MADDLYSPQAPLGEPEYQSVYTYFNQTMGMEVAVYTFNPASVGAAAELNRADWIRMRDALDLIGASPAFSAEAAEEKLISALKAASVIAIHGRVIRVAARDGGDTPTFDRSYQYVFPKQWATCMGLNIDEDSISLADGAPLVDIYLNRKDVLFWIEVRANPASPLKDDPDYLRRCDQRIHEIGNPDADLRFDPKAPAPSKGGRPRDYLWEQAVIHLMVNAVYHGGRLNAATSKAEIGRLLLGALNEIGPEVHPSHDVLSTHAKLIWDAFDRAEAVNARAPHDRVKAG
ncbi:hypothetical protein [Caulobacter sp.]|uniref:hypothetical protein n=1 Tax=Caulobacter sp. TaxID=78 RepID=UPI0031DF15D3